MEYLTTFKGLQMWYGHMLHSVGGLAAQLKTEASFRDHVTQLVTKLKHLSAALNMKHSETNDPDRKADIIIMLKKVAQLYNSVKLIAHAGGVSVASSARGNATQRV